MIDISSPQNAGDDAVILDTQTFKAANILSVQLTALEYAQGLGIDLAYFLSEDVKFQNSSFQSYCIQILAQNGINVATLGVTQQDLFAEYLFNLSPSDNTTALVAG